MSDDDGDASSLPARIRAAEAAVARRDAAFLREFDGLSDELGRAGRTGLAWLAGGAAAATLLLAIGALRPGAGRHVTRGRPRPPAAPAHHAGSWIAAALPLLGSLLVPGARPSRGGYPTGWIGLVWPIVQTLRRSSSRADGAPPLRTVAQLDLQRYAGAWFEYARLPTAAEPVCAGDVTVHYASAPDGTLHVLKHCIDARGAARVVRGVARPAGAPGRLEVTFAPRWLHWLPFVWADHGVLHVDADYHHAVVGTPDRRQLWLLSRTPAIERGTLLQLVELAQAAGFDIERLRRTPQRGG